MLRLCFYDGERGLHFTRPRDAISWLASLHGRGDVFIWATNLEYDLVNLTRDGGLGLFDIGYSNGSGRIIWARVRGTRVRLTDTLNVYKASVAQLGDMIGLPKLPFDPESAEYCERDAAISQRAMALLDLELRSIGTSLRLTAGSISLDLWRRRYQREPIARLPDDAIAWLRQAVFGGRTEIFKTYAQNLTYYDVNSLYPSCMLDAYPNVNTFEPWRKSSDIDKPGIVECEVKTRGDTQFPVLPWKRPNDGKLLFPVGTYSGRWTTVELRRAISRGAKITKIIGGVQYQEIGHYFDEYVKKLYSMRPRDGGPRDVVLKLLLNNLWGKFGQRNETGVLVPLEKATQPVEGKRVFQGHVFETRIGDWPVHANQVWAAWTTATARVKMHAWLEKSIDAGFSPVYMDTDSLILSGQGSLPESKELGGLKCEGRYTSGTFLLPKVYSLTDKEGTKFVAKGIPQAQAGSFLETGLANWMAPYRLKERPEEANVWRQKHRRLVSQYDKRTVNLDGSTIPLKIERPYDRGF